MTSREYAWAWIYGKCVLQNQINFMISRLGNVEPIVQAISKGGSYRKAFSTGAYGHDPF